MKTIISILLSLIAITTVSCSNDDTAPIYDDVLSNTIWLQTTKENYADGPTVTPTEPYDPIFDYVFSKLQYEVLNTEERIDTTWHFENNTYYYILKFDNDNSCNLNTISIDTGTFHAESMQIETRHYPNQTISETSNNVSCEMTVRDDSIIYTYKRPLIAPFTQTYFLGKNNIKEVKTKSYYITDDCPGAKESSKQYNMTFTRNGLNVELNGDIHLVGVLNAEGDEIEFNDIGKLQRTTVDDLPIITK